MLTVEKFKKKLTTWGRYRKTVRELSQLTDRDLNDLGISRGEITTIARKHCAVA